MKPSRTDLLGVSVLVLLLVAMVVLLTWSAIPR
jgi:hypothetical protein